MLTIWAMHLQVIDAEFAHFGCSAFDVGSFFAHLMFGASLAPQPEIYALVSWPSTRRGTVASLTQDWSDWSALVSVQVRAAWTAYVEAMRSASPKALGAEAQQVQSPFHR